MFNIRKKKVIGKNFLISTFSEYIEEKIKLDIK